MIKQKIVVVVGIVVTVAVSLWMSFASSPIAGIAAFFVLTALLWAIAKSKRWI